MLTFHALRNVAVNFIPHVPIIKQFNSETGKTALLATGEFFTAPILWGIQRLTPTRFAPVSNLNAFLAALAWVIIALTVNYLFNQAKEVLAPYLPESSPPSSSLIGREGGRPIPNSSSNSSLSSNSSTGSLQAAYDLRRQLRSGYRRNSDESHVTFFPPREGNLGSLSSQGRRMSGSSDLSSVDGFLPVRRNSVDQGNWSEVDDDSDGEFSDPDAARLLRDMQEAVLDDGWESASQTSDGGGSSSQVPGGQRWQTVRAVPKVKDGPTQND